MESNGAVRLCVIHRGFGTHPVWAMQLLQLGLGDNCSISLLHPVTKQQRIKKSGRHKLQLLGLDFFFYYYFIFYVLFFNFFPGIQTLPKKSQGYRGAVVAQWALPWGRIFNNFLAMGGCYQISAGRLFFTQLDLEGLLHHQVTEIIFERELFASCLIPFLTNLPGKSLHFTVLFLFSK